MKLTNEERTKLIDLVETEIQTLYDLGKDNDAVIYETILTKLEGK